MTALWGSRRDSIMREYGASCVECGWFGEGHFSLDSDAAEFAAADSAEHNRTAHPEANRHGVPA